MSYRLGNPPPDAPRWIVEELRKIEQAWSSGIDRIQLDPQYVAPSKPRAGATVMADGASWNPGSGAGPYTYTAGAWAALIGGGGGVTDGDKGDITVSGGGTVWTIDAGTVTAAKQVNVASSTIIGRVTAGAGVQEVLTGTQATTLLDVFTSALKGLAPASGGGTANFLRADGTWAAPGGGNSVTVAVDFGATWTDKGQTVVTGQAWVTAGTEIVGQILTPAGVDPDEMYLLGMRVEISSMVAGTGWTVTIYSESEAVGTYNVMCIGV